MLQFFDSQFIKDHKSAYNCLETLEDNLLVDQIVRQFLQLVQYQIEIMKIFGRKKFFQNVFFTKLKYYALQCVCTKKRLFLTLAIPNLSLFIYSYYLHPQALNKSISKSTQVLSQIKVPTFIRNYLYSWYCKKYNVNRQEMIKPLEQYSTFLQFFTRRIKERAVAQGENTICSPADSKILTLREITSDQCFVIKGYNYKFGEFICGQEVQFYQQDFDRIKKKKQNKLYQVVLYLSPGDYHRFHSPVDYQLIKQKVINGQLYSVSQKNLLKRKKVYEKNARLILHGKWKQGYLGMVMVGALNVGKIVLSQNRGFKKGQQMGYFSLGSTIVLIIEANDLEWKVQEGHKIKYGEQIAIQRLKITQTNSETKDNRKQQKAQKANFSIFDFLRKIIPF